ncbi:hypothetical protein K0M31_015638 [Melipona bicolor]|uniref:Uncharacterized protein n=1 Tax=Melipona bicolor TaxID=60889 RepID=A0AA40FF33_9HYME|nr:hypothetical protein K0M31_015638 [Melipona bicolor]
MANGVRAFPGRGGPVAGLEVKPVELGERKKKKKKPGWEIDRKKPQKPDYTASLLSRFLRIRHHRPELSTIVQISKSPPESPESGSKTEYPPTPLTLREGVHGILEFPKKRSSSET